MKQLTTSELLQSRKFYNEMTLPPLNIFCWDNLNKCESNQYTLEENEYRFNPNDWTYSTSVEFEEEEEEEVVESTDEENSLALLAWVRFGFALVLLYLGIKLLLL